MNDQPENRKTITIKINGKDRPFHAKEKEEKKKIDVESATQNENNETIYREESAAGSETVEESFDWILPTEEESSDEHQAKSFSIPNSKKNKPLIMDWKKGKGSKKKLPKGVISSIFFAVFFAVVLGTSFGFILLNMVNSNQVNTEPISNETAVPATKGEENDQADSPNGVVAKKEWKTIIVQNNILSTEERAKEQQQLLQKDGISSGIMELDGKKVVFIGVSTELEVAKEWVREWKAKDEEFDAFAKEITIPSKELKGLSKDEQAFMEESTSIYQAITTIVTDVRFKQTLSADLVKELDAKKAVMDDQRLDSMNNQQIKSMANQLKEAGKKTLTLSAKADKKEIDAIQTNLLTFLSLYTNL